MVRMTGKENKYFTRLKTKTNTDGRKEREWTVIVLLYPMTFLRIGSKKKLKNASIVKETLKRIRKIKISTFLTISIIFFRSHHFNKKLFFN